MSQLVAHVRTYSPNCRVGNWFEDVALEEEKLKTFLERKDSGDLLIQKNQRFLDSVMARIDLSVSPDCNVHFGDVVMLFNQGQDKNILLPRGKERRENSVVSVCILEGDAMYDQCKVITPCHVSGSKETKPVVKSAFIVTSCDGSTKGTPLKYGQPFMLKTTSGPGGDAFLQSDIRSFMKSSRKSRNQQVMLVEEPSHLCEWTCLHFNPQVRMEYEYTPVPANEKIVLCHVKTGQTLSVDSDYSFRTAAGREYEISCATKLDSHRAEKPETIWHIVMSVPGSALYGMEDSVVTKIEDTPTTEDRCTVDEHNMIQNTWPPGHEAVEVKVRENHK